MSRGPRASTIVLALAGLAGITAQACLIPLVGRLPVYLDVNAEQASWAVTITLIVGAVATPTSGRLADVLGRRLLLQWCIALTAAGAFVCAATEEYGVFVAGRALQGTSTAVIPLGISVLTEVATGASLRRGTAMVSATMGVGTAFGCVFAALVVEVANWRVVFVASGLFCLLAMAGVRLMVPSLRSGAGREPFDWWGFVSISVGLTASLLALTHGNDWGWSSPATVAGLAGGAAILGFAAVWELRATSPLVDLRVSASRSLGLVNLASTLTGVTMFLHILAMSALLQQADHASYGAGLSMLRVGLCLVPAGLTMMAFAPLGAWFADRRGHRAALLLGLAVIALGYAASIPCLHRPVLLVACSAVIGAGVGIVFATLPSVVHVLSPPAQVAAANGVNSLMRSVGTSLASATAGAVAGATTVAAGIVTGYPWMYVIGAGCAGGAIVLVALLPRHLDGPSVPI